LPKRAEVYLEPPIERAQTGVAAVARTVEAGELRIDDELQLMPLAAEEEDPELVKLRAALDHRIGEAQLPELLLEVDAQVRFSWIMLGREPRSDKELLMVYAGILAHGTSMSAAETARMMPLLSAGSVRQAMHCAGDARRSADASKGMDEYPDPHFPHWRRCHETDHRSASGMYRFGPATRNHSESNRKLGVRCTKIED